MNILIMWKDIKTSIFEWRLNPFLNTNPIILNVNSKFIEKVTFRVYKFLFISLYVTLKIRLDFSHEDKIAPGQDHCSKKPAFNCLFCVTPPDPCISPWPVWPLFEDTSLSQLTEATSWWHVVTQSLETDWALPMVSLSLSLSLWLTESTGRVTAF